MIRSKTLSGLIAAVAAVSCLGIMAAPAGAVRASQLEAARTQRQALQSSLDRAVAAYNGASESLEHTEDEAARAQKNLSESQARLKEAQGKLNARANTLYRGGVVSLFQVLFEARSFSDLERKMALLEVSASSDSADMIRAARARSQVEEEQDNLLRKREEQKKLVARLRKENSKVLAKFAQAQAFEQNLRKDRETELRLEQETNRRRANAVAQLKQRAAAVGGQVAQAVIPFGSGALRCPVAGATSFTDTYGASRSGGRSHQGVDMFAAQGTPVVAVVDGVVFKRSSGSLGGLSLWLRGGNGTTYYYAHLSGYADVPQGGRASAGTRIGFVGNTGARWAAPHLHFEVHPRGGAATNPYPTARAACR